ncbi:hypothetical protein CR513_45559, partial [Mucuna pruriens]
MQDEAKLKDAKAKLKILQPKLNPRCSKQGGAKDPLIRTESMILLSRPIMGYRLFQRTLKGCEDSWAGARLWDDGKATKAAAQKEIFHWSTDAQTTFAEVCIAVTALPIPLETDASSKGLATVLLQGHPWLFGAKLFQKEANKDLCMKRSLWNAEQFKWASKFVGYDFEIHYRHGKENTVADALSSKETFAAMTILQFEDLEERGEAGC